MDVSEQDGAKPFKVLYIDDEADKVEFIVNSLKPENIDAFVSHPDNAGVLNERQIALLKRVQLTPVLNNPTEEALKQDQTLPQGVHRSDPEYAEFEAKLTPASKAARDIYDGKYDVVITDMNMPANDSYTSEKFGQGGKFIASVARIAGVPLIVHSYNSRQATVDGIKESSPIAMAFQQKPSQRHIAFAEAVPTPRKLQAKEVYLALAAELEKLVDAPALQIS